MSLGFLFFCTFRCSGATRSTKKPDYNAEILNLKNANSASRDEIGKLRVRAKVAQDDNGQLKSDNDDLTRRGNELEHSYHWLR